MKTGGLIRCCDMLRSSPSQLQPFCPASKKGPALKGNFRLPAFRAILASSFSHHKPRKGIYDNLCHWVPIRNLTFVRSGQVQLCNFPQVTPYTPFRNSFMRGWWPRDLLTAPEGPNFSKNPPPSLPWTECIFQLLTPQDEHGKLYQTCPCTLGKFELQNFENCSLRVTNATCRVPRSGFGSSDSTSSSKMTTPGLSAATQYSNLPCVEISKRTSGSKMNKTLHLIIRTVDKSLFDASGFEHKKPCLSWLHSISLFKGKQEKDPSSEPLNALLAPIRLSAILGRFAVGGAVGTAIKYYLNIILHLTFLDRMPTTNSTPTHRTPVVSFGKQRCAGRRASTPQPNNQGSLLISTFSTPGMGQENATLFLPQNSRLLWMRLPPIRIGKSIRSWSPSYPHVWQMISPFLDGEIVLNPS